MWPFYTLYSTIIEINKSSTPCKAFIFPTTTIYQVLNFFIPLFLFFMNLIKVAIDPMSISTFPTSIYIQIELILINLSCITCIKVN